MKQKSSFEELSDALGSFYKAVSKVLRLEDTLNWLTKRLNITLINYLSDDDLYKELAKRGYTEINIQYTVDSGEPKNYRCIGLPEKDIE